MSIYSLNQAERGLWKRIHNNLICFNLVSYSVLFFFFSCLVFFWLSWSRKNCVYFTLRGWIPWAPTYLLWAAVEPKKNEFWTLWENRFVEIHWRWCPRSIYSRETRALLTLPRPANPVVFPQGLASALPAKRGPSSPSSLLRKPLAQSGLSIQRLIMQHPGFCLHSATFDRFTAHWHCCQKVGSRGN